MVISRLEDIRTYVTVAASISAGAAVVGEARELAAADQLEVALDGALSSSGVGTEPGSVSGRAA